MELKQKDSTWRITVLSNKNKIIVDRFGMVNITRGQHYGLTKLKKEIVEREYEIPEGVKI